MRVEVYRNLHKDCYSVRALEGPDKGHVIAHAVSVALWNPQFVVQPAGRAKVVATGRKNVHAFVRGELANKQDEDIIRNNIDFTWNEAKYDPYDQPYWYYSYDYRQRVDKARVAMLDFRHGRSEVSYI